MAVYQPTMVVADNGTVISLRSVESMNFIRTDEELTLDKLRDDCAIAMITNSGKEYQISMVMQIDNFGNAYNISKNPSELRTSIFERWVGLIS